MIEKPTVFNYEDHLAALEDLRRADITCTFCRHRLDCQNGGSFDCFDCTLTDCRCHDCVKTVSGNGGAGMDDRYDGLRYAIELGRLEEQKRYLGCLCRGPLRYQIGFWIRNLRGNCSGVVYSERSKVRSQ